MSRWLVTTVALAFCLGGCADAGPSLGASGEALDPARDLGACDDPAVDQAPAIEYVASVERWLEVRSSPPLSGEVTGDGRTEVADLEVVAVAADGSSGPLTTESVAFHSSYAPGITWGLLDGEHVYLALGSRGLERELVLFVLVETKDGRHFFPGKCHDQGLTQPLAQQLGESYDSSLRKIIGMTDADEIIRTLLGPLPEEPREPTILNPEDVSPEVLEQLDLVTLSVSIPDSWTGPYTVCTRIIEGWNECVPVSNSDSIAEMNAYVGKDRVLEAWLLSADADPSQPVQLLGRVDLDAIGERLFTSASGGLIRIDLSGALSASDGRVLSPEVVLTGFATWDLLLKDPDRYRELTGDILEEKPDTTDESVP